MMTACGSTFSAARGAAAERFHQIDDVRRTLSRFFVLNRLARGLALDQFF